jgi:hypothetical protein
LGRVTRPGGVVVLEYANKRNLKSIARRVLGRQRWSPFELGSVEYKPFHFDHAPVGIRRETLRRAGLPIESMRTASLFRLPPLTRQAAGRAPRGSRGPPSGATGTDHARAFGFPSRQALEVARRPIEAASFGPAYRPVVRLSTPLFRVALWTGR